MKAINVCVIALLCIGLTAAASYKQQIYGNCGGAEQHSEKVEAKAALWGKVERVVRYSLAYPRYIRGIEHVDYKSHPVHFEIKSGGIGTNYTEILFKSQARHGINSRVFFYAY